MCCLLLLAGVQSWQRAYCPRGVLSRDCWPVDHLTRSAIVVTHERPSNALSRARSFLTFCALPARGEAPRYRSIDSSSYKARVLPRAARTCRQIICSKHFATQSRVSIYSKCRQPQVLFTVIFCLLGEVFIRSSDRFFLAWRSARFSKRKLDYEVYMCDVNAIKSSQGRPRLSFRTFTILRGNDDEVVNCRSFSVNLINGTLIKVWVKIVIEGRIKLITRKETR